jgi:hypothetical protein
MKSYWGWWYRYTPFNLGASGQLRAPAGVGTQSEGFSAGLDAFEKISLVPAGINHESSVIQSLHRHRKRTGITGVLISP